MKTIAFSLICLTFYFSGFTQNRNTILNGTETVQRIALIAEQGATIPDSISADVAKSLSPAKPLMANSLINLSESGSQNIIHEGRTVESPLSLDHDVITLSIDVPLVRTTGLFAPQATITNSGTTTETFTVLMTIGSYTSTRTVTLLAPLANQQLTFDPWTAAIGTYNIQVCTQLSGDLNTTNDCKTQQIKVLNLNKQVYAYKAGGGGTDPKGQITFNLSDPGTLNSIADQSALKFVSGGTWADGIWYGTVSNTSAPFDFISINPLTGERTVIGTSAVAFSGLSYNTANGIMYGVSWDGTNSKLYSINRETGAATLVGTCVAGLLINLAINGAGQAYAVNITNDVFGTVDLATGTFTNIGTIGFDANYAQDMEFDRETGELYMAAYNYTTSSGFLGWVNQSTGEVLNIGNFEGGAEVTGLAIPYSGIAQEKTLSIKVFLEGSYNSDLGAMRTDLNAVLPLQQPFNLAPWHYEGTESVSAIPADVVDWVLVELRNAITAADAIPKNILKGWPRAFFLKSDGSVVDLDGISLPGMGTSAVAGNLFVIIRHRNHLATMSANAATLSGDLFSYDFTAGVDMAAGGAAGSKMAGSKAVMVAGDIDQDENIFVSDYNTWAARFGATNGYFPSDLDVDRNVFVSDYNKWAANFGFITNIGGTGGGSFTDARDGRVYKKIAIGTQIWMAENLAWLPSVNPPSDMATYSSYYYVYGYEGTSASAAKATGNYGVYGVLYNMPARLTACPSGWHLPSTGEWNVLIDYLTNNGYGFEGSGSDIAKSMAATSFWTVSSTIGAIGNDPVINNLSGFAVLPGGSAGYYFNGINSSAGFWSSDYSTLKLMSDQDSPSLSPFGSAQDLSVRCLLGARMPTVKTIGVSNITETSASGGGYVYSEGGASVTSRGVALFPNLWISPDSDFLTIDGTGTGAFTSSFTGLITGKTYYARAYATNIVGTAYGDPIPFTPNVPGTGSFMDARDSHEYKTVLLGTQTWMAENLAWLPSVSPSSSVSGSIPYSYVYGYQGDIVNDAKANPNFNTYGVLYNWPAAVTACPSGWHLPSDAEWTVLTDFLSNSGYTYGGGWGTDLGKSMAAISGWTTCSGEGTIGNNQSTNNSSGFATPPGGVFDGTFSEQGNRTYFWSTDETATGSLALGLWYDYEGLIRGNYYRSMGYAVRCLKN